MFYIFILHIIGLKVATVTIRKEEFAPKKLPRIAANKETFSQQRGEFMSVN